MFDHLSNFSAVTPLISNKENTMNDVTTFNFRSHNVRTILIDNEPWFVAKDVAVALGYANDTLKGDTASISYASVYPLGMFIRVVIAQMIIMFFV